jgi:hypothetical protein
MQCVFNTITLTPSLFLCGLQDLQSNAGGRCGALGMSLVSFETPEEIEALHIELSKDRKSVDHLSTIDNITLTSKFYYINEKITKKKKK